VEGVRILEVGSRKIILWQDGNRTVHWHAVAVQLGLDD
jgi:hypothetical protein